MAAGAWPERIPASAGVHRYGHAMPAPQGLLVRRCTAVLAAGVILLTAGCAAPDAVSSHPSSPASEPPSNDAVLTVSGTVVDATGAPAQGVHVELVAWPDEDTVAAVEEGDEVPLIDLGTATTDGDGAWTVHVTSRDGIDQAAAGYEYVNLEVMAHDGAGSGLWGFPVELSEIEAGEATVDDVTLELES